VKDLFGRASARVAAPPKDCLALLADIEGYPRWYPDVVRRVEVVDRDDSGSPARARATLHAAAGPVSRDLELLLAVTHGPGEVMLSRVPHKPTDRERFEVRWIVDAAGDGGSRIEVSLAAALDVPRLVPLGGIGESMAGGFVAAAARQLGA
jgi:polyketide cyclase/dehydrase/lipid transport protein